MNSIPKWCSSAIAAAALILSACSSVDGPTTPMAPDNQSPDLALLGKLLQPLTATERTNPLRTSYTVSGDITVKGGTLRIPEADFSITFAPKAVAKTIRITITADAGKYVSYDMLPHGINFSAPVSVTQGLERTKASLLSDINLLTGVYNDDNVILNSLGVFLPTELLKSETVMRLDPLKGLVPSYQIWQLKHFSRYMLASG